MAGGGDEQRGAALKRVAELQRAGRYAEALEVLQPLTRPHLTVRVAAALGLSLTELGRFEEAERWLKMAVGASPQEPYIRRLLGNLLAEMDRPEAAEAEYRAALAVEPDSDRTQAALGALLLSVGRYAEGWPLIEARIRIGSSAIPPVSVAFPEWQGEPLAGKSILVWYEQGFGDQIQMCRFARTLKDRGAAHVALGCRPPLVDLLATAPGVDEVIPVPVHGTVSVRRYDYWTRYFSLPGPLGVTLENLPSEPYLAAPADRRGRRPDFTGVGLAWRASPTGFNAGAKGVPDALAARILAAGARSLDPQDTGVADFADTAALIEQLDLVISIDTSVAHLAGALGKPCWTLLPALHCDWRWLRGRSDSPWYPSMRLYRQATPGRWDEVIEQVLADLGAGAGGAAPVAAGADAWRSADAARTLLSRTPAAARRVAYLGSARAGFEAGHRARNPHAELVATNAEALALEDASVLLSGPDVLARLAADGVLAALVPPMELSRLQAILGRLSDAGMELLQLQRADGADDFDDLAGNRAGAPSAEDAASGLVLTARRRADAPAPLTVCSVAFAPKLMDIRTRLPAHALRTEPDLVVIHQVSPFVRPVLPPETPKVQVLQRPTMGDLAMWRSRMASNIEAGWVVVLEYDDHPELVAEVAGRPVTEGDWLRFGCVHAVQTATPALEAVLAPHNPETRVFPNAAFQLAPFEDARPRRVFYGGVRRGPFAAAVARSLGPAIAERPDAEFVVVGDREVFEALPTDRKRYYDLMPYEAYLRLMGSCAVSLSPLDGRPGQETKSDAKFLDAAARGVLTIASPTVYAGTIIHGETGLIAASLEDWAPLLAGVLRDEASGRRMARSAWEYVRDHRMFADQVRLRRDWYRELWERRDELNAAVLERLARLPEG